MAEAPARVVGVVQTDPIFGRSQANREAAAALLDGVRPGGIYVLPELFATGYDFPDRPALEELAESPDGPTGRWATALCRERGIHLIAGFAERAGDKVYNAALVTGPSGMLGVYRKLHLFDRETLYFDPGDGPPPVFDLCGTRVGVMICFDWFFPETARSLALKGAQLIAHPANLVLPWCPEAMRTRALENRVYTATANRVGQEDVSGRGALSFTGHSQITGTRGEILLRLSAEHAELAQVLLDPARADDKAVTARNELFRDRRPGLYGICKCSGGHAPPFDSAK